MFAAHTTAQTFLRFALLATLVAARALCAATPTAHAEELHLAWLSPAGELVDEQSVDAPADLSPLPPAASDDQAADKPSLPDSSESTSLVERLNELEEEVEQLKAAQDAPPEKYPTPPTHKFSMEIQADALTSGQDEVNFETVGNIPNGTDFRRARLGFEGAWELTKYRIEMDFAQSGRPSFTDVWAGLEEVPLLGAVHVGHYFEPFSIDRVTSNRYSTFLERNLPDQFFAPARNLGISFTNHLESELASWSLGIFAVDSNSFGDDVGFDRGEALTGRVTCLPYWCDEGKYYVHLGAAGSVRKPNDDQVEFAAQPEARLGAATPNIPDFVDTGIFLADLDCRGGLEFAWINGPFSIQSEYMCAAVDQIGGPHVFFDGWYVQNSIFLTGEHRPYRRAAFGGGMFDRVIPLHNCCLASHDGEHGCGWGAWEVSTRLSHLDGNDKNILGRELTDLTFGMNWYLTPYFRMMSNYIHAFLDDPVLGHSDADIFGMRVQYDF